MRIALVGTRGMPLRLQRLRDRGRGHRLRLAARRHDVTVYCRPPWSRATRTASTAASARSTSTVAGKHLDAPVHSLLSTCAWPTRRRPDVAIYFIAGDSPFAGLGRLLGVPTAMTNVDGLDSPRAKSGTVARRSCASPDARRPGARPTWPSPTRACCSPSTAPGSRGPMFIPYGSELEDDDAPAGDGGDRRPRPRTRRRGQRLARLGLALPGYVLFMSAASCPRSRASRPNWPQASNVPHGFSPTPAIR